MKHKGRQNQSQRIVCSSLPANLPAASEGRFEKRFGIQVSQSPLKLKEENPQKYNCYKTRGILHISSIEKSIIEQRPLLVLFHR